MTKKSFENWPHNPEDEDIDLKLAVLEQTIFHFKAEVTALFKEIESLEASFKDDPIFIDTSKKQYETELQLTPLVKGALNDMRQAVKELSERLNLLEKAKENLLKIKNKPDRLQ